VSSSSRRSIGSTAWSGGFFFKNKPMPQSQHPAKFYKVFSSLQATVSIREEIRASSRRVLVSVV
jgi:hypothetical protein